MSCICPMPWKVRGYPIARQHCRCQASCQLGILKLMMGVLTLSRQQPVTPVVLHRQLRSAHIAVSLVRLYTTAAAANASANRIKHGLKHT